MLFHNHYEILSFYSGSFFIFLIKTQNCIKCSFYLAIGYVIFRLKAVKTTEELKDVHSHFLLYYGHEVSAMQESVRKKEREIALAARKARRPRVNEDGEEDGEEAPPEEEVIEVEEPPPPAGETLKQAVRSGPYAMCRKAGIGKY